MHIAEGILSGPVLAGGAAVAATGVAVGLYRIDYEEVPRVAVLSAVFFVASLIHVPVGPTNVHLVLNGFVGVVLGWAAFPALLVALFLQAVLFQFGGLTTLGVNTANTALPAVVACGLFARFLRRLDKPALLFVTGFAAGALAIALGATLMAVALWTTGKAFTAVAAAVVVAHVPLMVLEGLLTGSLVVFLRRVYPRALHPRI